MFSNENVQVVSRVSVLNFSLKNKCVFEESCPWNVLRYQVSSIFSWLNKDINSLNCSCRYFAASYQPARSWVFLLLSRGYHVTSRGVTRLDGARGEKQVRRPHVRTWGLSEAIVLYWRKYLWHCRDFSAPPEVFGALAVLRRPHNDSAPRELCSPRHLIAPLMTGDPNRRSLNSYRPTNMYRGEMIVHLELVDSLRLFFYFVAVI